MNVSENYLKNENREFLKSKDRFFFFWLRIPSSRFLTFLIKKIRVLDFKCQAYCKFSLIDIFLWNLPGWKKSDLRKVFFDYFWLAISIQPLEVFDQKAVLKNFAIFTGRHLCWSLFLINGNFIKKRLQHSCFPVNIVKFIRTLILKNSCKWLLISILSL